MSFFSWKNVKSFYQFYTTDNKDFLNRLNEIPLTNYDNSDVKELNEIKNLDLVESLNQHSELQKLYQNNSLISTRMGCVESAFLVDYLFHYKIPSHLILEENIDYYMRKNAGLYYKKEEEKEDIWEWWCQETKELIQEETITSCYCFLQFDLILWSLLGLKKTFYNYGFLPKMILQNSEGKKILYIGNAVVSIKKAYEKGIHNVWNFKISNFEMYYLKTPQTTLECPYPDNSIKETCQYLEEEIKNKYGDFDTAILGCGAYGPPLINMLRKTFSNKNLIYLGSDCFKMFGVYSKGMPFTYCEEANTQNWIEVIEERPPGCENHPEPKYWK